jgi:16S rRNA (cytosine1402-N4)-methyltransferase
MKLQRSRFSADMSAEEITRGNHKTVLLNEAIDELMSDESGLYIDGTYGRGGHSALLLSRLSTKGRLLAFDRDPVAVDHAIKIHSQDLRFEIINRDFSSMLDVVKERGDEGKVHGILLDLGVSSPQLDEASRGFSFMQDGPLDMRMNPMQTLSAESWINESSIEDMTKAFREYGEERYAKRIATAIDRERSIERISRTLQLAKIVTEANPAWEKHKHPATRVFQAVRIVVNDELGELRKVLADALTILKPGGRLVVIAFHSLEDRIVKQFMREQNRGITLPRRVPVMGEMPGKTMRLIGKAIKASEAEVSVNNRSRSAVMRVAEKLQSSSVA